MAVAGVAVVPCASMYIATSLLLVPAVAVSVPSAKLNSPSVLIPLMFTPNPLRVSIVSSLVTFRVTLVGWCVNPRLIVVAVVAATPLVPLE